MESDEWNICSAKEESTTDGPISSRAWLIFQAEIESKAMTFLQSEKDEIRRYLFEDRNALDSRQRLRKVADDCLKEATARFEKEKKRRK